jgi:hypothetical protein
MEKQQVFYSFSNNIPSPWKALLKYLWSSPLVKVLAVIWLLTMTPVFMGRLDFLTFLFFLPILPWLAHRSFGVVIRNVHVNSDGSFRLQLSDGREYTGMASDWDLRMERNRTLKLYGAILHVHVAKKLVVSQIPELGFPLEEIEKMIQIVASTKRKT